MFFLPALLVFLGLLVVLFWAMSPAIAQAAAMAMPSNVILRPVTQSKVMIPSQITPPSGPSYQDELDVFEEETIDLQCIQGQVDKGSVLKVEELVQAYQKEALAVIRGWMAQNRY
jgi:hypothetical protein